MPDTYSPNVVQILDFTRAQETSWQVRHDLDFSAFGIPGLTMINRCILGDGYEIGGKAGKENGSATWISPTWCRAAR
ncbi:OprD family outer membrane porin [Pseudomonas aeruginosa]